MAFWPIPSMTWKNWGRPGLRGVIGAIGVPCHRRPTIRWGGRCFLKGWTPMLWLFLEAIPCSEADNMHRSWRVALPPDAAGRHPRGGVAQSGAAAVRPVLDLSPWPIPASNEARPIGQQTSAVTRKGHVSLRMGLGPEAGDQRDLEARPVGASCSRHGLTSGGNFKFHGGQWGFGAVTR